MPRAVFFAGLGMFVVPRFFDRASCARLRREMRSACTVAAPIRDRQYHDADRVDEDQRKTEKALVSIDTHTRVMSRLMSILPAVQDHFGIDLAGCQPLSFLIYREGYHFVRHIDTSAHQDASQIVRERRVSISIFLNGEGQADEPDSYSGGSLTFCGSLGDPVSRESRTLPLTGEEGLLIGFRSDWPHSIEPVSRGTRYSIVTWFT